MTVSQEAAVVNAAGRAGPARDEVRLRDRLLRGVHRADRRAEHQVVPDSAERAAGTAVTTVEGASATTGPRFSMTRARTRHPGPLTPIRPGVLPRLHRFKDMGMGRGLR